MSEENSNQELETEELFEDPAQTDEGDGTEDKSAQDEEFLKKLNQETGKNFKSLDDWKNSFQNLEKAVANQGRKKEPTAQSSVSSVVKELFFDKHPEAKDYWETVEKEASLLKKDPFDLYLSSGVLKGEAKAKYEADLKKEDSANKMEAPASSVNQAKSEKVNPFMKDFPPGFAINNSK